MESMKSRSGSFKKSGGDDDYLFNPPPDLVCPITHEIFKDPVLNSVGHMYEREAFLQYLENKQDAVDPLSRAPVNRQLTPVISTRGRAMEYRENAARLCVDIACQKECTEPVKYLRRAAELCTEVDIQVPGLSQECREYVLRFTGNAYDVLSLRKFAEGLLASGFRDKAAAVYYNLLRAGEDKTQQAELLKNCVECWSGDSGDPDNYTLQKLTEFVLNQEAFSWGQIVDIMNKAGISEKLTLRLCEELLAQSLEEGDQTTWNEQRDVLVKYVTIHCRSLADKQNLSDGEIQRILEWKERLVKGNQSVRQRSVPISALRERRKPFFLRKRFLAGAIFTVSNIINGAHPVLKIARTLPVLYLLNSGQGQ